MPKHFNISCDGLGHGRNFGDIDPNPDVSGIGVCNLPHWIVALPVSVPRNGSSLQANRLQVLIGFLTTAYLTLLLVIVYYLMGCVEKKFLNEIDHMSLYIFHNLSIFFVSRKRSGFAQRLKTALPRMVLMFSD